MILLLLRCSVTECLERIALALSFSFTSAFRKFKTHRIRENPIEMQNPMELDRRNYLCSLRRSYCCGKKGLLVWSRSLLRRNRPPLDLLFRFSSSSSEFIPPRLFLLLLSRRRHEPIVFFGLCGSALILCSRPLVSSPLFLAARLLISTRVRATFDSLFSPVNEP